MDLDEGVFDQILKRKLVRIQIEDIGAKIYRQCLNCGLILTVSRFQKHSCNFEIKPPGPTPISTSKSKSKPATNNPAPTPIPRVGCLSSTKTSNQCDICNKNFISEPWLRRHKFRFHRKIKSKVKNLGSFNKCHHCKKTFSYPSQLKIHKKSHFQKSQQKTKFKLPKSYVCLIRDPVIERKSLELLNNSGGLTIKSKSVSKTITKPNEISSLALVPKIPDITNNLYELQSELDLLVEDFEKMDPEQKIKVEPFVSVESEAESGKLDIDLKSCDSTIMTAPVIHTHNNESTSSSITNSLIINPPCLSSEHQLSIIDSVASNNGGDTTGISISSKDTTFGSNLSEASSVVGSEKMDVDGVEKNEDDTRKCLSCGEIVHLDNLFAHLRSHLYKGQRTCNFCDYKAIATGDLRDHVSKHYNFRPYKCPICFKCYTWQSGFKKHVQSHDADQKPYKCSDDSCGLKFTSQRERRRHELTHKNLTAPGSKTAKKAKPKSVTNSPGSSSNTPTSTPNLNVSKPVFATQQHQYQSAPHQQYNNHTPYQQPQNQNFPNQNYYGYDSFSNSTQQYQYPAPTTPNTVYPPTVPNSYSSPNSYPTNYPNANGYPETPAYNYSSSLPGTPNGHQAQSWNASPNYKSSTPAQNGRVVQTLKFETGTIEPPNLSNCVIASPVVLNSNSKELQPSHVGLDKNSNPKIFKEPEDTRVSEQCKTCGIDVKMADLSAHILSHITPGQKLCSICNYKCNTKVYLIEHYNIHYSLKPFICTICTRRFAMRSYLRSHMQQVHETEESRNYKCRFCDKKFVRPCHQRSHEKIHESNGDPALPPIERAKGRKTNPKTNIVHDSTYSDSSNSQPTGTIANSNSFPTPIAPAPNTPAATTPQSFPVTSQRPTPPNVAAPAVVPVYQSEWQTPSNQPQWTEGTMSWQSYAAAPSQVENSNQWSQSDYQYSTNEPRSWSNSYYDSPVIRSDVNWTAQPSLDASQSWDTSFQSQNSTTNVQYKQENWYDSSSSGVYSTNDSSNIPPSASVQDLWTDLQYELKLLPEKTSYTSDGIPMVTEIAPAEVPSFTDLLNMVTSDLPGFTSPTKITMVPAIPDQRVIHPTIPQPLEQNQSTSLQIKPPSKPSSESGPRWRPQGRASGTKTKTRLTAEAKHKMNVEQQNKDIDGIPAESPQQSTGGSESDDDEELSPTSVKTCITCGKEVVVSELLDHIHNHLIPGQRTCDICHRTYCNYVTLRDHVHVHYKLKPYKCAITECAKTFMSKYTLKVHEALVHNQGPILKCEHCSKPYVMKSELVKHIKAHHAGKNGLVSLTETPSQIQERRTTAELAAEAQRTKEMIEQTRTRLVVIKLEDIGSTMTKKCPFCNIEVKLGEYYEHKYSHEEECHICKKPVPVAEILYHGPTHVGTMVCEVCGWSGAQQRSQLWEHMNGHLQVKPLKCLYCGIGFASRNSLRSHYLALHTKFRPHKCRYCEKTFVQGNTVKQHELTHFGTQCPICNQNFELKKDLRNHLKEIHKESD